MKISNIFSLRKILSVIICTLFFTPRLQVANGMDPHSDKAGFSYNVILNQSTTISIPPEIKITACTLEQEYFNLIGNQCLLGEQYSEYLINWRTTVFNHYERLFGSYNEHIAIYFLLTVYKMCHKEQHAPISLCSLQKSEVYLITPTQQENAILPHIASDPNGSIQIRLHYRARGSVQIERTLLI